MEYQKQYEHYLFLAQQALERQANTCFEEGSEVGKAACYSLFSGGKRVRAVLCLAVCDMLGGDLQTAADYAAAIEMLHCYSLIHDDLPCMDDDDMRRGKPSCHKAFGEATALLAGDALLTAAFEVLCKAPNASVEAVSVLSSAAGAKGMIYGQELDLRFEQVRADARQLEQIHANKTGKLIKAAVLLGAVAANASKEQKAALEYYATQVGMVFQIVDDILDEVSTSEELGKPVGSDRENGKSTFVSLYGLEESRRMAQEKTKNACDALEPFEQRASFLRTLALSLAERKQ